MATPFLGEIILVGFNFTPPGYAACNGQLMPISQNDALFNLIGTTYGGDGQDTFALPNLQSRIPIGQGQGPGLQNYVLGEQAGVETVTLTQSLMPPHSHEVNVTTLVPTMACQTSPGNQRSPVANVPAVEATGVTRLYSTLPPNVDMNSGIVMSGNASAGNAGGNQPHTNIQPVLCVAFLIALEGIFPSTT